ncbi:Replication initiator protein A (plasmid) [Rubrobacter radiotolerans]|uniref:Plasmid replication initiator TrfA n=1 Tax=Rubrobacter radiotolerans TaxID=42256 RepID=A0A023X814_RUBRA|nr:plasmid replication initiator TrfA [Rubrobacter radiotolerans]AHY48204.1 Replication initiator protein A [Rubrobacter radiotolerans]MDX5895241.1 plasmid replication initiator TrfA [Rubrobacter radiotolerans]SMC01862.1 Replication initiator protein A [Rubrobacter radiotolerans DSM 5868]
MSAGEARHIVKAEGNFEDLPYFTVGKQSESDGVIEYKAVLRAPDGQMLKQTWTVRASSGLGLPGSLDQDVYVALLQIIDRQGGIPSDGVLSFSMYELMGLVGRTVGGRDYQQVKRSLERLNGTMIHAKNAFYVKSSQSFLNDKTFNLLDYAEYTEVTDSSGRRVERMHVKLSNYFVQSYNSDYLKGLDVDFYYSLNSAVAKRLYRFVDKKRNHRRQWEVDLFSLRDRIPLSSNYKYPSKIKEKLDPAHQELVQKGFLESVTYTKMPDKSTLVCYRLNEGFSQRRPTATIERSPENLIALERLKVEGVWEGVAEDLVARFGADWCIFCADKVSLQKNIRDRGPYLKRVVEGHADPEPVEHQLENGTPPRSSLQELSQPSFDIVSEETESSFENTEKFPVRSPEAEELWNGLLRSAFGENGSDHLGVWFEGVVPASLRDATLTVVAPNEVACDYLRQRFLDELTLAGRKLLAPEFHLRIVTLAHINA